jgi:hypothetical protein
MLKVVLSGKAHYLTRRGDECLKTGHRAENRSNRAAILGEVPERFVRKPKHSGGRAR